MNADPDAEHGPELVPDYGHHEPWCSDPDAQPGTPVAEHGPLCESRGFPVDAWGTSGDARTVWASLVGDYRHGLYRAAEVVGRPPRTAVQLVWEADDPDAARVWGAHLSPGDARSLAAALVRLADAAEGHDRPILRAGVTR